MDQSQKDANIKAAWITGGLALVGTVITLLFTNGPLSPDTKQPPPPPPTTTISPPATTSSPPSTETPTPTTLVPPEIVGNWRGGPAGQVNLHLRITESADYVFWDDSVPDSLGTGKVGVKGAILELYGNDGYLNRFPWSVEETPQGHVLHLGANHYLRE